MPGQYGDELIYHITHLTDMPQADVAEKTLRKMASLVKPIIRAHGWRVGMLGEFYPDEEGLLGLNCGHGQTIHVRLRHGSNPAAFLPFEMSMDTLLHELCHNTFGPHDAKFHAMWDQVRDEYWALKQKGFTGESFLGRGYKVGGKLTKTEARRIARVHAMKAQPNPLAVNQRLGGKAPPFGGKDPRQAARDTFAKAAESRLSICGVGRRGSEQKALVDSAASHSAKTKLEGDNENDIAIQEAFIDLVQQEREEEAARVYGGSGKTASEPMLIDDEAGPSNKGKFWDTMVEADDRWECVACTLLNQPADSACAVCGTLKPGSAGKSSSAAGPSRKSSTTPAPRPKTTSKAKLVDDEDSKWWRCENCTLINKSSDAFCDACECDRDGKPKSFLPASRASSSRAYSLSGPVGSGSKPSKPQRVLGVQTPVVVKEAANFWTCAACGLVNESTWWTCTECKAMKSSSS